MIRVRTVANYRTLLGRVARAALVLVACATALTACATPLIPESPAASATATPSPVTDSPAPPPDATTSPTPTSPGSPSPDQNDTATECSAAGMTFALQSRPGDSGAGSFFWDLRLTNTSGEACMISGYPGVLLISAESGATIGAASGREPRSAPSEVRLEPGDSAFALLHLTQAGAYGCPLVAVPSLEVTLPDTSSAVVSTPDPIQGCDDPNIMIVRTAAFATEPVTF